MGDPKESGLQPLKEPFFGTADRAGPILRQIRKGDTGPDSLFGFSPLRIIFVAADLALVHFHGGSLVLPEHFPAGIWWRFRWACRVKSVADPHPPREKGGDQPSGFRTQMA